MNAYQILSTVIGGRLHGAAAAREALAADQRRAARLRGEPTVYVDSDPIAETERQAQHEIAETLAAYPPAIDLALFDASGQLVVVIHLEGPDGPRVAAMIEATAQPGTKIVRSLADLDAAGRP
jgi:hypothetical protein